MNKTTFFAALPLVVLLASGCSTVSKINNTIDKAGKTLDKAGKAIDNVSQLAKGFNEALTELKAQAKSVGMVAPAAAANVPALPAMATGSVDITKAVMGKSGAGSVDVDSSGTPDAVNVFVADSQLVEPTGIRPLDFKADDAQTFLSWKGDAESGDEGQCYLGWEHAGKAWFIISACGAKSADVCSYDGTNLACSSCDEQGACKVCDNNQSLENCNATGGAAE
jgi:uncharacterized protein YceK